MHPTNDQSKRGGGAVVEALENAGRGGDQE